MIELDNVMALTDLAVVVVLFDRSAKQVCSIVVI